MPPPDGPVVPYAGSLWRLIEEQSRPATMRLVDTDAEQAVLEDLLEESKPPVPEACRHLDYRLWSPFRYGRYPRSSRFRRAGPTPGVWYGSEHVTTALAEAVWGTLQFYSASTETPLPRRPVHRTAIEARVKAPLAVDLTDPGWAGRGRWDDPDDYSDCLALAEQVRKEGVEAIRYRSVRDPEARANVAVLTCPAFEKPAQTASQSWQILFRPGLVRAYCETTRSNHSYAVGDRTLTTPG